MTICTSDLLRSRMGDFSSLHLLIFFFTSCVTKHTLRIHTTVLARCTEACTAHGRRAFLLRCTLLGAGSLGLLLLAVLAWRLLHPHLFLSFLLSRAGRRSRLHVREASAARRLLLLPASIGTLGGAVRLFEQLPDLGRHSPWATVRHNSWADEKDEVWRSEQRSTPRSWSTFYIDVSYYYRLFREKNTHAHITRRGGRAACCDINAASYAASEKRSAAPRWGTHSSSLSACG